MKQPSRAGGGLIQVLATNMDSKSLDIAIGHLLRKATWHLHDGNEYVVVGDGVTIYEDRLSALVGATIGTDALLYSSGRGSGGALQASDAAARIAEEFSHGAPHVVFADASLHHLVQVLRQGVARSGDVGG
jgi:hypothetical protein